MTNNFTVIDLEMLFPHEQQISGTAAIIRFLKKNLKMKF